MREDTARGKQAIAQQRRAAREQRERALSPAGDGQQHTQQVQVRQRHRTTLESSRHHHHTNRAHQQQGFRGTGSIGSECEDGGDSLDDDAPPRTGARATSGQHHTRPRVVRGSEIEIKGFREQSAQEQRVQEHERLLREAMSVIRDESDGVDQREHLEGWRQREGRPSSDAAHTGDQSWAADSAQPAVNGHDGARRCDDHTRSAVCEERWSHTSKNVLSRPLPRTDGGQSSLGVPIQDMHDSLDEDAPPSPLTSSTAYLQDSLDHKGSRNARLCQLQDHRGQGHAPSTLHKQQHEHLSQEHRPTWSPSQEINLDSISHTRRTASPPNTPPSTPPPASRAAQSRLPRPAVTHHTSRPPGQETVDIQTLHTEPQLREHRQQRQLQGPQLQLQEANEHIGDESTDPKSPQARPVWLPGHNAAQGVQSEGQPLGQQRWIKPAARNDEKDPRARVALGAALPAPPSENTRVHFWSRNDTRIAMLDMDDDIPASSAPKVLNGRLQHHTALEKTPTEDEIDRLWADVRMELEHGEQRVAAPSIGRSARVIHPTGPALSSNIAHTTTNAPSTNTTSTHSTASSNGPRLSRTRIRAEHALARARAATYGMQPSGV